MVHSGITFANRVEQVSSDSESDSEEEEDADETEADEDEDEVSGSDAELAYLLRLQQLQSRSQLGGWGTVPASRAGLGLNDLANASTSVTARLAKAKAKRLKQLGRESAASKKAKKEKKPKKKRASKLEFKRVDQLWDSTIHNYKLTDTAEDEESSEYDQYLFNVRRTFDWEGKYKVC